MSSSFSMEMEHLSTGTVAHFGRNMVMRSASLWSVLVLTVVAAMAIIGGIANQAATLHAKQAAASDR